LRIRIGSLVIFQTTRHGGPPGRKVECNAPPRTNEPFVHGVLFASGVGADAHADRIDAARLPISSTQAP
jgi:hypothetical protein